MTVCLSSRTINDFIDLRPTSNSRRTCPLSATLAIILLFILIHLVSPESNLCAVDWVFCQGQELQKDVAYTKQIYEVLLESWKDPLGMEEFFQRQEENGQNLTFFSQPSIQLMVFLNDEKQSLPVGARQAVDTVLSLLVNESFLKEDLDERKEKAIQVVDSFALSPEEKTQLDGFLEVVRDKAKALYGPEISNDLIQQFGLL